MARNISPGACYQWHEELAQWLDANHGTVNSLLGTEGYPSDPMLDNYEHGDPFVLEGEGVTVKIRVEESSLQITMVRHDEKGNRLPPLG